MAKDYFQEIQTVRDMGLAQVLSYAGYDIPKIVRTDNTNVEFHVCITASEFEDVLRDYKAGNCNISDARAFCYAQAALSIKMKRARIEGVWIDRELAKIAKSQGVIL